MDAAIDAAFAVAPVVVVRGLANPASFFGHMRSTRVLGPTVTASEVEGCEAILKACADAGWSIAWTAYALATAFHETAGTMLPIREYGRGKGRKYGRPGADGQIAYGRGYVQLTWPYNYERADEELGLGGMLIRDFDLALDHAIAARVLIGGMAGGWFTSKSLKTCLPDPRGTLAQFIAARTIINGRDKDRLIAGYAVEFQKALVAGGWE
ncbi:hypothetical protein [Sphingomonas sp. LY160]|uniref:hypothetical protein n=1 Tax=Sphingomonas sp. LY160 TaxID=3095342 RepID=UPI002ADEB370|nr:hypothetical protein [Sphingomonas sp. LY160]MEA1071298.1 hypothetical protein [Sphingomonas sp. LY160]